MVVGDGEDEDGNLLPGVKKHLSLKKTLRDKKYKGVHKWPPPEYVWRRMTMKILMTFQDVSTVGCLMIL